MVDNIKNKKVYYFFSLMLYELFILGSGQLVHIIGSLTLRMLLFIISIILFLLMKKNVPSKVCHLCILFFIIHFFGIIVGVFNDGIIDNIVLDLKPLIYFYCILPFCCIPVKLMEKIPYIIISSTLLLSVLYLIYIVLMKIGIGGFLLDFTTVYDSMTEESDFMFRGDKGELYYKGFIFLPIGAVFSFFYIKNMKYKLLAISLLSLAIFYSQTRALLLLLIIVLFFAQLYKSKSKSLYVVLFFLIVYLMVSTIQDYMTETYADRDSGDLLRITTYNQVISSISGCSILFGHGLGIGVPIRPIHMECAFLEIFHKQGLLGIIFWFYYLFIILNEFKGLNKKRKKYLFPYVLSVFMIYFQSFFNPYLINPMGLGFINLVYILIIKQKSYDISLYGNLQWRKIHCRAN